MTDGAYDAELSKLYPSGTVDAQKGAIAALSASSEEFYGSSREAGLFSAPSRTEIGGNHTDHITTAACCRASILMPWPLPRRARAP